MASENCHIPIVTITTSDSCTKDTISINVFQTVPITCRVSFVSYRSIVQLTSFVRVAMYM